MASHTQPVEARPLAPLVVAALGAAVFAVSLAHNPATAMAGAVAFAGAVVLALRETHKPIVTWPNAIVCLVLVIWLIPIRLYRLPVGLPFNLEPYRIAVLLLIFGLILGVMAGHLPRDRSGTRAGAARARRRGVRLAGRELEQPRHSGPAAGGLQDALVLRQLRRHLHAHRRGDPTLRGREADHFRPRHRRRDRGGRCHDRVPDAVESVRGPGQLDPRAREEPPRGARAARRKAPRTRVGAAPDRPRRRADDVRAARDRARPVRGDAGSQVAVARSGGVLHHGRARHRVPHGGRDGRRHDDRRPPAPPRASVEVLARPARAAGDRARHAHPARSARSTSRSSPRRASRPISRAAKGSAARAGSPISRRASTSGATHRSSATGSGSSPRPRPRSQRARHRARQASRSSSTTSTWPRSSRSARSA